MKREVYLLYKIPYKWLFPLEANFRDFLPNWWIFFLAVLNFHDPKFEPNSNFKNGSDHAIVKYSLYTVILGETRSCTII